jgi:hypothetical protein
MALQLVHLSSAKVYDLLSQSNLLPVIETVLEERQFLDDKTQGLFHCTHKIIKV